MPPHSPAPARQPEHRTPFWETLSLSTAARYGVQTSGYAIGVESDAALPVGNLCLHTTATADFDLTSFHDWFRMGQLFEVGTTQCTGSGEIRPSLHHSSTFTVVPVHKPDYNLGVKLEGGTTIQLDLAEHSGISLHDSSLLFVYENYAAKVPFSLEAGLSHLARMDEVPFFQDSVNNQGHTPFPIGGLVRASLLFNNNRKIPAAQ